VKAILLYNPGVLPSKPGPANGEELNLCIEGLPPIKKRGISLRNPSNPRYAAFVALRAAATEAMHGRAWYFGPIRLELVIYGTREMDRWKLIEYVGGIMDTLDRSSGRQFTYLPVAYEDDCQVCDASSRFEYADEPRYELKVQFLWTNSRLTRRSTRPKTASRFSSGELGR